MWWHPSCDQMWCLSTSNISDLDLIAIRTSLPGCSDFKIDLQASWSTIDIFTAVLGRIFFHYNTRSTIFTWSLVPEPVSLAPAPLLDHLTQQPKQPFLHPMVSPFPNSSDSHLGFQGHPIADLLEDFCIFGASQAPQATATTVQGLRSQVPPSQVYNTLMSACSRAAVWKQVLAVLESMEKKRVQSDLITSLC